MGPKNAFFQHVHFWGPNWVGGAWYGIFLIREKPAIRAGALRAWLQRTEFILNQFKSIWIYSYYRSEGSPGSYSIQKTKNEALAERIGLKPSDVDRFDLVKFSLVYSNKFWLKIMPAWFLYKIGLFTFSVTPNIIINGISKKYLYAFLFVYFMLF